MVNGIELRTTVVLLADALCLAGGSAQAQLLLYEPFDYTADTPLTGLGTDSNGMTGTWTAGVSQADGTAYVLDAASGQVWDGTLPGSSLPITGGFAGGNETIVPNNVDHFWGERPMDASVTETFVDGTTTWMSAVFALTNNPNHRKPMLAIGAGALAGGGTRAQRADGQAIGGGANYNDGSGVIRASYWDDETEPPDAIFERHNSGGLGKKTPQEIFVAKIEWGAVTDTVTVYNFAIDDTLTEAEFDLATKQTITSVNNLDQSAFDTLSFAGSRFFLDEIRIGKTFDDVVTGTSVGPGPDPTIPGDANDNGFVDDTDLAILLGNWEQDPSIISTWALGNFTEVSLGDTDVNDSDLAVLLGNWTGPPPPGGAAVPEPVSALLLLIGAPLAALRRRRRQGVQPSFWPHTRRWRPSVRRGAGAG